MSEHDSIYLAAASLWKVLCAVLLNWRHWLFSLWIKFLVAWLSVPDVFEVKGPWKHFHSETWFSTLREKPLCSLFGEERHAFIYKNWSGCLRERKISSIKAPENQVWGLTWLTGSWSLERDTAAGQILNYALFFFFFFSNLLKQKHVAFHQDEGGHICSAWL